MRPVEKGEEIEFETKKPLATGTRYSSTVWDEADSPDVSKPHSNLTFTTTGPFLKAMAYRVSNSFLTR